jgi:hypothetical protein
MDSGFGCKVLTVLSGQFNHFLLRFGLGPSRWRELGNVIVKGDFWT